MKKIIRFFVCCFVAVTAISCLQKPEDEPNNPNQGGTNNDPVAYYLCGNINGADYAYGKDASNLGDYKFVNGKVVVSFTGAKNYVCVRDNKGNYYMFDAYTTTTSGVLKNYQSSMYDGEKMFVASGEYVFTLKDNGNNTFTLSYAAVSQGGESGVAYIRFCVESNSEGYKGLAIADVNGTTLTASMKDMYDTYSNLVSVPAGKYYLLVYQVQSNDEGWYYFNEASDPTGYWTATLEAGGQYEYGYTGGGFGIYEVYSNVYTSRRGKQRTLWF